jgi:predicted nucleic acid-binding protein
VGLNRLRHELAGLSRVCLDTSVVAYHLADHPRYADYSSVALEAIEHGAMEALVTTVTLAELLTFPAQRGDMQTLREWELYLTNFPNILIVPLDQALARETALVRAETHLKTPDAVQVAAARLHGADAILTNDRPWAGRVSWPRVLTLDDSAS